jgi:hypothetical protein
MKTFLGLDLRTGGRIVLWSYIIESSTIYVLSLALMIHSTKSNTEAPSSWKVFLLYEQELQNLVGYCKAKAIS